MHPLMIIVAAQAIRATATVAHRASTVVRSTAGNLRVANIPAGSLVAVSTVGNLNAANIHDESLVGVNIGGNSRAVNIPVESLAAEDTGGNLSVVNVLVRNTVAANILTESPVASKITNLWAKASLATERDNSSWPLATKLSGSTVPESNLAYARVRTQLNQSQYANMATQHKAERKFRASLS
jgi:hypothetical protein